MCAQPRQEFFRHMDAVNVDLKAFSERFYKKICSGELAPVLETLEYLKYETGVWVEITTLLIPGKNDSDAELHELCSWVAEKLGPDVPLHFSAFHPDWKMMDISPTSPQTLSRAREIAQQRGIRHSYTGNVHDCEGGSTYCHQCGILLIERDWYRLGAWNLDTQGKCASCGVPCAGVFEAAPGDWGAKRQPVSMAAYEAA